MLLPKPTFLAFWGLALSSPVPFHISPGRDDSSCPRTAPLVSHSSREAVPKGGLEPGPGERHLPAHVLEQSGGSTISLGPLQNALAVDQSLSKVEEVCHRHLLSSSNPFHAQNISTVVGGAPQETTAKVATRFLPALRSPCRSGTKPHSAGLPKLELRLALYKRSTSLGWQRL